MELKKEMMELSINDIRTNPHQAREQFDEGKILLLSDSIKEIGVNTPIQLVWQELNDGKRATIQDGERRFRAMKRAGITELKYGREYIIVDSDTDEDLEYKGLIANCMREDLQPCEKGRAFMRILKRRGIEKIDVGISIVNRAKDFTDNGFLAEPSSRNYYISQDTVKQVAKDMKMIGVSGTNAVDLLKILKLPKDLQEKIVFAPPNSKIYTEQMKINRFGKMIKRRGNDRGEIIPMSFAREFARLDNEKLMRFFLDKSMEKGWTAKKLTLMINDFLGSHLTSEQYIEAYKKGSKQCNIASRQEKETIEHITTDMDNFSSTLTSFRTINLFALSDNFHQKMFMVSAKGLRPNGCCIH